MIDRRKPVSDDYSSDNAGGYGRPPRRHRLAPGETRNPWGRRGKPGPKTDFLDEIIEIRVDGKCRRVSRAQAVEYGLFQEATKGNVSAAKELDRRRSERNRLAAASANSALSSNEQAALDRLIERRLAEERSGATTTAPDKHKGRFKVAAGKFAPGCKK